MMATKLPEKPRLGKWAHLATASPAAWLATFCLLGALLFFVGLEQPGFYDNEGRYAEVAREMLLTGDWLTPHMNGEVFLNKPPLMFWLTAGVFRLAGFTEAARSVSGLATLFTLLLLYDLGRRLWKPAAGLWSTAIFLTMSLTTVEARSLRPDALLTVLLCLTLWGVVRIRQAEERRDPVGMAALWGGVGVAVMTKGLLGLALPVLAFAPALLLARETGEVRYYLRWPGLLLAAALVLPWHLAAGVVNEGFWWDYVVNQHFLVFFDRKFPRDHIPHPLWFTWPVFTARLFPWVLLLPAAWLLQVRHARAAGTAVDWLPLTWFGAIFLFFSSAMGRLEHHFIPAVPAAALLVGNYCAHLQEKAAGGHPPQRWLLFLPGSLLLLGALGFTAAPVLLNSYVPSEVAGTMTPLARFTMAAVALGGLFSLALVLRGKIAAGLVVVAGTFLVFGACAARGLSAAEPLVGARPLIRGLDPALLAESEIAYEAGEEYQQCGVLDYYLQRKILLLEPPGFIPPTYLKRDISRLFVKRDRFQQDWTHGDRRYLLFTDPQKPLDRPGDFPQPYYEVARGGGRIVITNLPLR